MCNAVSVNELISYAIAELEQGANSLELNQVWVPTVQVRRNTASPIFRITSLWITLSHRVLTMLYTNASPKLRIDQLKNMDWCTCA